MELDYLNIDGYRSSSLKESVAMLFAYKAETDDLDPVLLRIRMQNKKGKYYVCLDKEGYTVYPEEKEVLLQAGLVAKIESFEVVNEGELTIFNLYISDELVEK
jgi:hypothetical protein